MARNQRPPVKMEQTGRHEQLQAKTASMCGTASSILFWQGPSVVELRRRLVKVKLGVVAVAQGTQTPRHPDSARRDRVLGGSDATVVGDLDSYQDRPFFFFFFFYSTLSDEILWCVVQQQQLLLLLVTSMCVLCSDLFESRQQSRISMHMKDPVSSSPVPDGVGGPDHQDSPPIPHKRPATWHFTVDRGLPVRSYR